MRACVCVRVQEVMLADDVSLGHAKVAAFHQAVATAVSPPTPVKLRASLDPHEDVAAVIDEFSKLTVLFLLDFLTLSIFIKEFG